MTAVRVIPIQTSLLGGYIKSLRISAWHHRLPHVSGQEVNDTDESGYFFHETPSPRTAWQDLNSRLFSFVYLSKQSKTQSLLLLDGAWWSCAGILSTFQTEKWKTPTKKTAPSANKEFSRDVVKLVTSLGHIWAHAVHNGGELPAAPIVSKRASCFCPISGTRVKRRRSLH